MYTFENIYKVIINWLVEFGPKIILIILGGFIIKKISSKIIREGVKRMIGPPAQNLSKNAEIKRENTLIKILNGALGIVIWITVLMMILSEVGIEIGPMLAAVGIVGVAVGFGGQYLIKDLISGFFIIIENQYRIDDVVCFGDICGLVEDISLRMTTLRDLDGKVHHVPHGEVKTVSNLSKGFARVNLNIGVAYESDIEEVEKIINKIGEDLSNDPDWKDKIREAPKFLRIDNFGDSSIDIKILGDTEPMENWSVAGELRKRIKIAFDKNGISIPYPQRTISYLEDKKD